MFFKRLLALVVGFLILTGDSVGAVAAKAEDLTDIETGSGIFGLDRYVEETIDRVKEAVRSGCMGEEESVEPETETPHEPGFYFVGVRLHAADENGSKVVDALYGGLPFNSKGEVTSGSDELDELIWAVMEEKLDPSVQSCNSMLRTLYNYCVREFRYRGRNLYEIGETGWEQEEALAMLSKKKGNCYSFAAAFYYFARALGYNPTIYSGAVYGMSDNEYTSGSRTRTPHGWVEIESEDGEVLIYDPEMEYKTGKSFWAGDETLRHQYGYKKEA